MRSCLVAATAVLVCLLTLSDRPLSGQDSKSSDQEKAKSWMKQKLEASQNILAGLTESDFEKVRTNAEALGFLGYLEKSIHADNADYKRQMLYFDFANRDLIRQAKDKNLDGAILAYNQLTTSCVHCHQIIRDVKK